MPRGLPAPMRAILAAAISAVARSFEASCTRAPASAIRSDARASFTLAAKVTGSSRARTWPVRTLSLKSTSTSAIRPESSELTSTVEMD